MALIEQRQTDDELGLRLSDGATLTITKDDAIAHFNTLTGPPPQKRTATVEHFQGVIETFLGLEPGTVTIAYDWTGANTWQTFRIQWGPDV
jgi:hypothetical protein